MITQISISGKIYESLFKAKETLDNEYDDALNWIMDIIGNETRDKKERM